jgi:hypothetical protein
VRHAYSARDFQDSRNHEANLATAHGVTGAVVGTTNTQALTNKTALAASATTAGLVVMAAAAQTANILDVQDAAGATIVAVTPGAVTTGPAFKARTVAQANIDKKIVDITAPAVDVTPLAVTALLHSTADTVTVTVPQQGGSLHAGQVKVGPRGNVSVIALADATATALDVAALSVQGGYDGAIVVRDLQRWSDYTGAQVAKVDAAGNITAPNIKAVPLVYTDAGVALTSVTVNTFTTALRTVTNPFGVGVPYRCKCIYQLGIVGAAAGVTARASIATNGSQTSYALVSSLCSAKPQWIVDMPSGGTVTFQAQIVNLTGAMSTYLDAAAHFMTTEVSQL